MPDVDSIIYSCCAHRFEGIATTADGIPQCPRYVSHHWFTDWSMLATFVADSCPLWAATCFCEPYARAFVAASTSCAEHNLLVWKAILTEQQVVWAGLPVGQFTPDCHSPDSRWHCHVTEV